MNSVSRHALATLKMVKSKGDDEMQDRLWLLFRPTNAPIRVLCHALKSKTGRKYDIARDRLFP